MALQSNIINITKVRDGVDANSARISTNVETTYKFAQKYTQIEGQEDGIISYNLSPSILSIGIIDTNGGASGSIINENFTCLVSLKEISLEEVLKPAALLKYINKHPEDNDSSSDIYNYYFHIQEFYNALYSGTLEGEIKLDTETTIGLTKEEILNYLFDFFETINPVSINFIVIYGAPLYKFIPLQIGTNLDIAKFSIDAARGIFASMQNAKLEFTSDGLAIKNGNFSITNSNKDSVLRFDKESGNLSITGEVHATSGTFTGEIHATSGTFTGKINSNSGTIGGFNIESNTIYSDDLILKSANGSEESSIYVKNITLGIGALIEKYLKIGNLSLLNPQSNKDYINYDNSVLKLIQPHEKITNDSSPIAGKNYYTLLEDQYVLFTGDSFESGTVYYEDGLYFQITNEGYINGNNWSIKKESGNDYVVARFGKLIAEDGEFNGIIRARDGVFTGEVLSSIITASTINTANFVTEKTRSMGGSFVFKPTFPIQDIQDKGNNNIEFTLSENSNGYFSVEDIINLTPEIFEQGGISLSTGHEGEPFDSDARIRTKDFIKVNSKEIFNGDYPSAETSISWVCFLFFNQNKTYVSRLVYSNQAINITIPDGVSYVKIVIANDEEGGTISPSNLINFVLKRISDKIVAISGFDTRFGKIIEVNENKIQVELKNTDYNILKAENALENYKTLTLFGSSYYDTLIGINSDDISAGDILPPRALSMETFTSLKDVNGTGDIDYSLNLLLGDLDILKQKINNEFNYLDGYGLYADNVFLHGSLMTKDNAGSYAGIHTSKDLGFSYESWGGTRINNYNNEKIIFWGGANSLADNDIQKSPFIVTDKGSIFASRGEFKGTVIADSIITDAIIKTPVIYGSGNNPSLRIYDTDNNKVGIGFYKLVGNIDLETKGEENDDILTLNINNLGFTHYANSTGTNFIQFNENNNNIYFNGTSLTTGTTIFSSRSIKDQNGSSTAAEITISGYDNNTNGEIELKYGTNGIQVSNTGVWNFGGKVQNDGEIIFYSNNTQLDYKIKNGYYCLYVS